MIDKFSNFGWTISLKNKNAKTIKDSFENILKTSKRKANLGETGRGKNSSTKIFIDFYNKNSILRYNRFISLGAVFAERFNRTIRNLLEKLVYEYGDGN